MATPRRSTRIAARTPSVIGSDAGSQAGDRHVDRRSNSPTNAGQAGRLVSTRISSSKAYGSTGSDGRLSSPPEDMEAPTAQQGFATSFTRQRERARASAIRRLAEGEDDAAVILPNIPEASEHSNHTSTTTSSSNNSFHRLSPSHDGNPPADIAANNDGRPPTRDTHASSFGFGQSWNDLRETAFVAWAIHTPAWYNVARRVLKKIFTPIFSILSTISRFSAMLLGLIFSLVFFYLMFDLSVRAVFFHDVTVSEYMHERSSQVAHYLTGSSPSIEPFPISDGQHGKFNSLYNNVIQVQNKVGLLEEDMDFLKRKVPDNVMLTYNPKTGRNEIPGAFWHALRDNLAQEGLTSGGSSNAPSWTDFWKHNKAHLDAYLSDTVDPKLREAIKDHAFVDKETFISMIEDDFKRLETRLTDMESAWNRKLGVAFDHADEGFLVGRLPKGQLSTMATSLLLENAWSALHSVNFFSRSLGAVVDPHLTSPTMASRGLTRRALQKLTWIPGDLPPAAALVGWEEPTDCWCAARSPGSGQAQIGIIMPHKIVPETLVVEHIPRDGTLDIGSAPRGMELWVEVEDEGVRAAFASDSDDNKPGPAFVRVGSFEYRVDALNHVQAFDLNSELLTQHPVNKAVVRVTGTWGRDWACLYRLRMNGRPVDQFSGYEE